MRIGKKSKVNVKKKRITLLDDSITFQAREAFNTLRTNLIFALSTQESRVIAVSSSLASEGKSTTSANIAIALSQTDARVLIIDGDMRKSVQHRIFKLKNKVGLSTLLGGLHSADDVINSNVIPNVDVITAGPIPPNPSEMLGSNNMKVLLTEISRFYDYIIVDTPPIGVVSDALTFASHIAGFVLVTRQGSTPRDSFAKALSSIEFANGKVLGAVINNVSFGGKKYEYKYKYKNYQAYSSTEGYEYAVPSGAASSDED